MPRPSISDYYRAAAESVQKAVDATPDDRVLGMEFDAWVKYLVDEWGMEPIALDPERQHRMTETEKRFTLKGYDYRSGMGAGTEIREAAVRVDVAVVPSSTTQVIWKQELTPNSYSLSHRYPPFEYSHHEGYFSVTTSQDEVAVKRAIDLVQSTVSSYNQSIASENATFVPRVRELANARRERIQKTHRHLDALAAATGIPLTKKADVSAVIPTALQVRKTIQPVLPPASKPPTQPVLEVAKFRAILDLIDNQCRQFERTPQAFQQLTEEGLRDVILSSLNAVFEGAAGGETFQGTGKVDIYLRIDRGQVFVAELKLWTGQESLHELIGQLRGRLTWRDGYGVAIVLSRNAGFTEVLKTVGVTVPTVNGYVANSLRQVAQNHLEARFRSPDDAARQANIHVCVYNLHAKQPGKRTQRRVSPGT